MIKYLLLVLAIAIAGCSQNDNTAKSTPSAPGEIKIISDNEHSAKSDNVSPFLAYNVTGEYIVRYSPDGEETAVTKQIGANIVIRNKPYDSIHKSLMMKRLSKAFIVKCSACHDDYGNGVIGPSLLTKSENEIFDMIIKYKTDKSLNVLMQVLVSKMSEDEVRFIAKDIARFNEEIRKENSK